MSDPTATSASNGLCSGFLRAVELYGDRPALEVADESLTYRELFARAASIAATLQHHAADVGPPLTAVFAYRSRTAFAAVLGALMRGHGYVPLNTTFPAERNHSMLVRSQCRALVMDSQATAQLPTLLGELKGSLLILLPELSDVTSFTAQWPQHRFLSKLDLQPAERWQPTAVDENGIAYLLFTSGSTGVPKGVMVSHRNARHYIEFAAPFYRYNEHDRCSQTFDLTFDLSVHDMFVTWEAGACLCCPAQKTLIKPSKFITESKLSVWFSVPSTGVFMQKLGALKPASYPNLRLTLFCGEALPLAIAKAWAEAAPNSVVENIYGPTELTIACTRYRFDAQKTPAEAELDLVPIGEPFPGMIPLVADESLNEVAPGADGELLFAGPQRSLGYYNDAERTRAAFVRPPGRDDVFYRTGDRVRRNADASAPMIYLGRIDNQVKVLGHRVELGEVEAVIRRESGVPAVVALGWPVSPAGCGGIEAFLQSEPMETATLLPKVAAHLPSYMTPRRLHCLKEFPLNANGKIDRKALLELLKQSL